MRGVHNNLPRFSPFRTAPRTVVRLALYFTVQNADHLKSAQYIHQDFFDIAKRTIHLAMQIEIDNDVFFILFFACFLFSVLSSWFAFSISYFIVLHLPRFFFYFCEASILLRAPLDLFQTFKAMSPSP